MELGLPASLLALLREANPRIEGLQTGVGKRAGAAGVVVTPASEQASVQALIDRFDFSDVAQRERDRQKLSVLAREAVDDPRLLTPTSRAVYARLNGLEKRIAALEMIAGKQPPSEDEQRAQAKAFLAGN